MFAAGHQPGFQPERRGVELRGDLLAEARDQRILAPLRSRRQSRQRRTRLGALAHAFDRRVVAVLDQRVEAGGLGLVVQQVSAEDLQQTRLGQERRQREKHEMTLGTLSTPAVHRFCA